MIAEIKEAGQGFIATFERHFEHPVEHVWAMLTENEKLKNWFVELHIVDLSEGGLITFDMQDGTFEEMHIIELKSNSVLEFNWAEDIVRFELYAKPSGCLLIFKEKLRTLTNHTPKDLAGWHVCLDVIQALLDGRVIESRKQEWETWYEKYVIAVNEWRE